MRDWGSRGSYKIVVDPKDMKFIFGGAQDNATPFSDDNLASWSNIGGGDGGFVTNKSSEFEN